MKYNLTTGKFINDAGNTTLDLTSGNVNAAIVSKSANYTVTIEDNIILCNDTSASFTLTLFTAVGNSGRQLIFKKTNATLANQITIDANGSETIDGSTTTTINTQNETLLIISDGSNWQILNRRVDSVSINTTCTTTNLGFTAATNSLEYWRDGEKLCGKGFISYSSGTGSASALTFTLPGSLTIDTTKLGTTDTTQDLGTWSWYDDAGSSSTLDDNWGWTTYNTSTTLTFRIPNTSAQFITNVMAANDRFSFNFCVPITNWKG